MNQKRLLEYKAANPVEEENALKEIVQKIILFSLWRADFFQVAAFQGGTSLRILHGLSRFSEDIDFPSLRSPKSDRPQGEKISSINWKDAAADVERFLKPVEQKSLSLWSERFYTSKLDKLDKLLL